MVITAARFGENADGSPNGFALERNTRFADVAGGYAVRVASLEYYLVLLVVHFFVAAVAIFRSWMLSLLLF